MDRNLEFLDRLCARMTEMSLVYGDGDFSEKWLGRGQPYLRSSIEKGRAIPDKIVVYVEGQIKTQAQQTKLRLRDLIQQYRYEQELLAMFEIHRLEQKIPQDQECPDVEVAISVELPQDPTEQMRGFLDKVVQFTRLQ